MAAASGPIETSSGKTVELAESTVSNQSTSTDNCTVQQSSNDNPPSADLKVPTLSSETKKSDTNQTKITKTETSNSQEKRKGPVLSPAEQLKQSQVVIPYKEPIWSGLPPESESYSLDVLKNGTLIENIELGKKPWIVFGRLPSCDVCMEHPSLSRHHAVIQYRDISEGGHEKGWYLFDLDSTHGTWVNKMKIKPKAYRRLRVGHVVKFGGSSRLYILQVILL